MSGHCFRPHSALTTVLAGGLVGLSLAGCGGSSGSAAKPQTTHAATTATKSTASPGSSVTSGPVRATLIGPNHHPVAKKSWIYTLRVADAHGHPLSGILEVEFTFQGAVVGKDTPPAHRFQRGVFKEDLKYPAAAVGYPVDLQVAVHTKVGSVTLHWPVTVRK